MIASINIDKYAAMHIYMQLCSENMHIYMQLCSETIFTMDNFEEIFSFSFI